MMRSQHLTAQFCRIY